MARNFDLSIRLRAVVEGLQDIAKLASEIEEVGTTSDATASQAQTLQQRFDDLRSTTTTVARFEALEDALERTGTALGNAREKAGYLEREMRSVAEPTEEMRREFAKATAEVKDLEYAQEELGREATETGRRLEQMGVDTKDMAGTQDRLEREVRGTQRAFEMLAESTRDVRDASAKDYNDPTDRMERGARSTGTAMDNLGGKIKRLAVTAGASIAAFFGVREALRGIVSIAKTGSEMEILEKRLEAIMGSLAGGERATAWIKEFTKTTPFQLNEVTEAFIRAKAFGMDPMNGTMQAIADQASLLGGDMETLTGITNALGQAYAKQKLQGEEILQLVERGVPVWDLLSKAMGKSTRELQEMSSAGELGRKQIDLLIQAMGEKTMGAAADQMETLSGRVSNLKDTLREFVEDINRQGFLDYVKGEFRALAERIEEMKQSGELRQWAKRISDSLIGLMETIKGVAGFLIEYRDAIMLTAKAWIFYKGAQAGAGLLTLAASLRTKVIPALAATTAGTNAATGAMKRLRLAIFAIPGVGKIALLALAVTELPGLFDKAGTAIGNFAGRYSQAGRNLAATQERIREDAERNIELTKEEIREHERYRDTQLQSADAVAAMSQAQRKAYEEQLQGLQDLQVLEYRLAMLREQTGEDTTARQKELRTAIEGTRDAMQGLEEGIRKVQEGIDNGLNPSAVQLIGQFNAMREAGDSAEEALSSMFETLTTPGDFQQVESLVQAMQEIRKESFETGEAVDQALSDALRNFTGEELQRFVITLKAAFGEGKRFAGEFAETARAAADAAFRNLGSSLREFETGISDAERSAIDSFRALEDAGILTGDNVGRALETLVDEIKSPEAVQEVMALMDAFERRGIEVSDEVRDALEAMAESVEGTAQQIGKEIRDAIEGAGTKEELAALGERLRTAWREGEIGVEEYREGLDAMQEAHRRITESAEEGAGKAGDAWSKAGKKAKDAAKATKEVGDSAEESGEKSKEAASSAGSFLQMVVGGMRAAVDQIDLSMRAMAKLPGYLQTKSTQAAGSIEQLKDQLKSLNDQAHKHLLSLNQAGFVPGLNRWLRGAYKQIYRTQIAYTEQRLAVQELTESLQEASAASDAFNSSGREGVRTSHEMRSAIESMGGAAAILAMDMDDLRAKFDHLDEADLSGLYGEIQRIQSEIRSLNESLQDTVRSFEQELAALEGDTARVEQLKYQEEQLELQEQLNKAKSLGDRDAISSARKALELNSQIHDQRLNQIREQAAEEKAREAERQADEAERRAREEAQQREERDWQKEQARLEQTEDKAASDRKEARQPVQAASAPMPSGTVNLNIAINGQRHGTLSGVDEDEAARLLTSIERAQLTAPRY